MNKCKAKGAEKLAFKVRFSVTVLVAGIFVTIVLGFYAGVHVRASRLQRTEGPSFPPTIATNVGAELPVTTYTLKTFGSEDGSGANNVISWVAPDLSDVPFAFEVDGSGNMVQVSNRNGTEGDLGDYRTPNGVQLLVDISFVDNEFLDYEAELTNSLLRFTKENQLTILSYHCQKTMGVSCIGVLLEGHVSFHSQPASGTISFDVSIYARTSSSQHFLKSIMEVFGKPQSSSSSLPEIEWSRKIRGFVDDSQRAEYHEFNSYLGFTQTKKSKYVASVRTEFHQIDIIDVIQSRFVHSSDVVSRDSTDEYPQNRVFVLDGERRSSQFGEAAYHEVLVHPAMLTVEEPKRVAILGGGTGAALREVLKHKSVEKVVMIESDEKLIQIAKEFLPSWNDCSVRGESFASCFDDPRLELHFEHPRDWFVQRFSVDGATRHDGFDVVIMDDSLTLDYIDDSSIDSDQEGFVMAVSRALGDYGTFLAYLGKSSRLASDVPLSYKAEKSSLIARLVEASFESVIDYSESHGFVGSIQSFLMCLKDSEQRSLWFKNEAEFRTEIDRRMNAERVGGSPLRFLDGATVMALVPSKADEQSWCYDEKGNCPLNGHGYDPETQNFRMSESTKIAVSEIENVGRATYATKFIPKGSFLGLEECTHGMFIPPTSVSILESLQEHTNIPYFHTFSSGYIDGYGWYDFFYGFAAGGTDAGLGSFVNHGCNGTYNVGIKLEVTEAQADPDVNMMEYYYDTNVVYDPYNDRQYPAWACESRAVLRDIEIGDELLDNYLTYGGGKDPKKWHSNLIELKSICMGSDVGLITRYEKATEIDVTEESDQT